MARSVVVNGRFLGARTSGVQRVAAQLTQRMDRILAERPQGERAPWSLIAPRDATAPLALAVIQRRSAGLLVWQPWEQLDLPRLAAESVLVNLCNLAPLAHPRSITLIHDAQVFLTPGSYSAPFRAWYQFALPRIGAAAARVVTVSEFSRAQLVKFGVAPADRISVVPNGVDHLDAVASEPAIIDRLGLRAGGYVLGAGNAQTHKNLGVLFRAFAGGAMDGLSLVLAGADGAEAFTAAGTPPPDGVVFAGRVSDGALKALYENAACLAFPSTTEGFGLPPLEAMGLGCPVVVAPCGALPEVCGEAALYAGEDDPAAWARAITSLAQDAELRRAMIARGRQRAALYRWDDSARAFLDIVEAVAA